MHKLTTTQRGERLPGCYSVGLALVRRVDSCKPNADAALPNQHDESVTINDVNNTPGKYRGCRRTYKEH